MIRVLAVAIVSAMAMIASGCGVLLYGTTETIPISSEPPGASVTIDGEYAGVTPLTAELKRKSTHEIRIEKTGYAPYETSTVRAGNYGSMLPELVPSLLFPPAMVLAPLEYLTGAAYKIVPDNVSAQLVAETATQPAATAAATQTPPSPAPVASASQDSGSAASDTASPPPAN
jgi:hypothetical protein